LSQPRVRDAPAKFEGLVAARNVAKEVVK